MKNDRQTKTELIEELESVQRKVKKLETKLAKQKHTPQGITKGTPVPEESEITEEHNRSAIETSHDGLLLVHRSEGGILHSNVYARELLGYSSEEFSKSKLWEIGVVKDDQDFQEALSRLENDGVVYYDNISVKNKAGLFVNAEVILVDKVKFIQCNIRDNTERKRTEEQLRQSEKLFRLISENATDLIAVLDRDGKRIYNSPSYMSILGDPESLRGTDSFQEVHPDDREKIKRIFLETATTGIGQRAEYRFLLKDGSVRYIESMGSVIRDENGNTNKIVVVSRDVTERNQAAKALRESDKRFSRLAQASFEGIAIHDENGILDANRPLADLFGYELSEMIGMSVLELAAPESRDLVRKNILADLEEPYEAIGLKKDGTTFTGELIVKSMHYQGRIVRVTAIRDITKRKQAEETTQRLAAIVESSDDAIIGKTLDGTITSWNNGAEKIYGYSAVEIVGRSISLLLPPEQKDELTNIQKQIKQGLLTVHSDTIRVRKDGSRMNVSITISPVLDGAGKIVGASTIARDITERKEAEKQIALLAHTLKSIAECVSITDLNDIVIFVNSAFLKTYGYTEQEILGKNINVVRSPNNSPEVTQSILTATLTGGWSGELMNRTNDGREFPVSLSTSFVRDEQGQDIALVGIATDITERKLVADKLQESKQRYNALFERSLDLVYVSDFEGNFIDANDAALNLLGYKKEEIGSLNFTSLLNADQLPRAFKVTQEIKETGIQKDMVEFRLQCRNGQEVYVESIGSAIISDGIPVAIQSIARNITERKQAEEKLSKSEEKYRTIFENVQDVYYEASMDGTILEISPSIEVMSKGGYHRDDLIGKSMLDFYAMTGGRHALLAILQEESGVTEYEVILKNRDGSHVPCSITAKIQFDAHRTPLRIIGSMRDITFRKRAEENVRKLSRAVEQSPASVIITNTKGDIEYVNPKFTQLTGYTSDEVIGKNPRILKSGHTQNEEYSRLWETIQSGKEWHGEFQNKKKNGELYWESASLSPIFDEKGTITHFLAVKEDITERKRTEEALKKSEEKLKELFETAPVGYHELDALGNISAINQTEIKMLGYSYEEMIGWPVWEFTSDSEESKKKILDKLAGNILPNKNYEQYFTRRDGTSFPVLVDDVILNNERGVITGIRTTILDITKRKRAEEALRETTDYLENLLSFANAPIMVWDNHNKITKFNLAFEAITGYTMYDVLDKQPEILFPDETREQLSDLILRASNGENLISIEMPVRCKDGSVRNVVWNTANIYAANDKSIIATIAHGQDVTKRKQAEESLQESELRFRSLYENTTIGLYRTTPDGKILLANPALVKMLGYTSFEKLAERNLEQGGFESSVQRKEFLEKIEREGEVTEFDSKWIHQDSSVIFVLESARAIRDSQGKTLYYDGTVENITNRKKLEEQMRQMQKLESLGTLAGGIAHDFNNILGIILAYVTTIDRMKNDPEKLQRAVDTISTAVQRGAALVRQILTFARKSDVEFELSNINTVAKEVIDMILETFPRTLTYSQNLQKDIPTINADRSQIHQALLNLCVNARDAMPNGGVLTINTKLISSISLRNRHPDALASTYLCIEVGDTGIGMTKEVRDRIFEPFFTTKEKGKGTGLGLAVVFGVVKTHKGYVEVESELGKGSTFRLYFPVPSANAPVHENIQEIAKEIPGGTETLLVVEDEETLMAFLQISLAAKGYTIISAIDGPEAVKIYRERNKEISMVFTDLGLPGMTGMEEINLIKKINQDAKIIVATGYLDPEMKTELLKVGVKNFVLKPYNFEEIMKLVRNVMDEK